MSYYDTILEIINNRLDGHNITTNAISTAVGVARKTMVDFRNGDKQDNNMLFDIYNYLYQDLSDQDRNFLRQQVEDISLKELKVLYKNKDLLFDEIKYIKKYQYNDIMRDVLAIICIKNSRNILRERVKHESNTLL